jgi:hypothetical protein
MTLLKKPNKQEEKEIRKLSESVHELTRKSGTSLYTIVQSLILDVASYLHFWREETLKKQSDNISEKRKALMVDHYKQAVCLLLLSDMNIDLALQTLNECTATIQHAIKERDSDVKCGHSRKK